MSANGISTKPSHVQSTFLPRRNLWSGFLFGLGLVAFVDETVFHQLLHWHHFYDKSSKPVGLVSDGIFHAFSWFCTVGGMFMLAHLRKHGAWQPKRWYGGLLLGGGLFQLYDGTIQHKLMRLHQIRYVDDVILYDMVWNTIAAAMIAVGIVFIVRSNRFKHQRDNV